jgi:hypothetical protein
MTLKLLTLGGWVNNRWKYAKVSYDVSIGGFLWLHSNWGQKFRILRMHKSAQHRILAAWLISKNSYLLNCWSYQGVQITIGKKENVFYNSCIGLLVRFPVKQSQIYTFWLLRVVKLDLTSVSTFSFEELLVDWACPLATVFHLQAWSSIYIRGCSIHKVALIHRSNS